MVQGLEEEKCFLHVVFRYTCSKKVWKEDSMHNHADTDQNCSVVVHESLSKKCFIF